MKLRFTVLGISTLIACANLFGQAEPVVGAADPTALFKDKDKTLNTNKQAAMHIVIDLLAYGHWNEADKWLTEKYIQHNPAFGSGRQVVMTAFSKSRAPAHSRRSQGLEHQDRRGDHSGQGYCLRGFRQYPARSAQSRPDLHHHPLRHVAIRGWEGG